MYALENEINSFPEKAKISVSAPTESINVNIKLIFVGYTKDGRACN
jgi:hypothetical protein